MADITVNVTIPRRQITAVVNQRVVTVTVALVTRQITAQLRMGRDGLDGDPGAQGLPGATGPQGLQGEPGTFDSATAAPDNAPLDTDEVIGLRAGTIRTTWTVIKAFFKTYFDGIYPWSAGKPGGQTITGGTSAGEGLTLASTANATKGSIIIEGIISGEDLNIEGSSPSLPITTISNNNATISNHAKNYALKILSIKNNSNGTNKGLYIECSGASLNNALDVKGRVSVIGNLIMNGYPIESVGNFYMGGINSATAGNLTVNDKTNSYAAGNGGHIVFAGDVVGQGSGGTVFGNLRGIKENSLYNNSLGALVFGTQSDAGGQKTLATVTEKVRVTSSGNVGIGTTIPGEKLEVAGNIKANQYKLSALNTAPASATDTGTLGEIRLTADFIYVCTAINTWVRAALTTW